MKRKYMLASAVVVLLVLAFPLLNLILPPETRGVLSTSGTDMRQWEQVAPILARKCVHCHAPGAERPFYASFPIARSMIAADIAQGLTTFDMTDELQQPGAIPVTETALAKIEFSVLNGTMPPKRYVIMHWNHRLGTAEKTVLLEWARSARRKFFATAGVTKAFASHPIQPLPTAISLDQAEVALGDALFHDKRLSGNDTIACASCHSLDKGGTDRQRFAGGINKQLGDINSPTVFNSGFQFRQFWDGRAADLEEQAAGPVSNPIEMGASWADVVAKLKRDERTAVKFDAIYSNGLTEQNIRKAIATFERSLITPNSRLDRYLRGDETALTRDEKEGLQIFTERGCAMCHVGKLLGGQSFEKFGLYRDYFARRGNVTKADLGRYNVTKAERDKHKFKVPTLRNIALTGPYFHDGSTTTLEEAVEIMASHQLKDGLSRREVTAVAAFLETLTGQYEDRLLH